MSARYFQPRGYLVDGAPAPGRYSCGRCLAHGRELAEARHARLAHEGTCVQCGTRPAQEEGRRCEACAAAQRERMRGLARS